MGVSREGKWCTDARASPSSAPTHTRSSCEPTRSTPASAQTVVQAEQAILDAFKAGQSRQLVEVLLPLIGATDLDDWYAGRGARAVDCNT